MIVRSLFICALLFAGVSSAQEMKTGEFIMKATPAEVLGDDASLQSSYIGENELISWEVYVPENYDPSMPPGVMVFAGAPRNVHPPMGWLDTMKEKNLIWVAARNSDNGASIYQKELLAMMSVPLIEKDYTIDKARIYITGEGRTAGRTVLDYPQLFNGAIFMGNRIWENNAEEKVKNVTNHRFVFVTREKSIYPKGNRYAYNKFKNAGVKNIEIILIQGKHRYDRPKFSGSIDYLDD